MMWSLEGFKLLLINEKNFKIFSFIIIAAAAAIIYSNSLDCNFHFDDEVCITDDKQIQDITNYSRLKAWLPTEDHKTFKRSYRPISTFSIVLNYYLHDTKLLGYHLVNILVHIINGFLIFILTVLLLSSSSMKKIIKNDTARYLPLFTALIFVAHPLQTQSITYIVQRMASIAAVFYLLAIITYIHARSLHQFNGLKLKTVAYYCLVFIFQKKVLLRFFLPCFL